MAARIVDVDVTDVNRHVPESTLAAIRGIEQNYGHAGPAFVRALIDNGLSQHPGKLRGSISVAARKLAGDTADSASVRAATPLAVLQVAGYLAQKFELIPSDALVEEAGQWAWNRFAASSDAEPLKPEEQIFNNLRTWIIERWDVTIKKTSLASREDNNREAVGWYDRSAVYIPKNRLREATGNTFKDADVGSILDRAGMLESRRPDRFTVNWIPNVGPVTAYALKRTQFGRYTDFADPNRATHPGGLDE
jgi:hypothetical protein